MNGRSDLRLVSPRVVLEQVAHAIPKDCRANIIIIGSLAVRYHFFGNDPSLRVHTKDIDCLLSPRIRALPAGKAVTERLFGEQWTYRVSEEWPGPGDAGTRLRIATHRKLSSVQEAGRTAEKAGLEMVAKGLELASASVRKAMQGARG